MPRAIPVDLEDRSYRISVGGGLLDEVGSACVELGLGSNTLVVTDANVGPLYADRCEASLREAGFTVARATVTAGEPSKSLTCLAALYTEALAAGLTRKSCIVALGGGVVGDLAGFAAASYLRGVDYVQVPTSVVAMVDSAVGGKTGINLPEGKNLVGAFYQPRAVLVDPQVLRTLPEREYLSGLAEVVKYGIIRDRGFFALLESRVADLLARDEGLLGEIIARSCELKADVVRLDEREGGLRAILNFGHTLGHAVEKVAGYGVLLHGEAIAIGMVYAAELSVRELDMPAEDAARIRLLLEKLKLPTTQGGYPWRDLRKVMQVDKKADAGVPRFVLAREVGKAEFGCVVPDETLEHAWSDAG